MPLMRSVSEPPEEEDTNLKTGLRGGFPIKINGQALGSQDNLQEFGQGTDIFGPRIRSRQSSVVPQDQENDAYLGRRRSLRGTTPVKIAGMEFTTNAKKDDLIFSTPFGPTQAGAGQNKKGGIMGKRSLPQYQNNNSAFTPTSLTTQNRNSSLLNLSLLQDATDGKEKIENTSRTITSESQASMNQLENESSRNHQTNYMNQCNGMITENTNVGNSNNTSQQKKEEHLQKKITIRASHSESKEREITEQSHLKTQTFSNQIETESFEQHSAYLNDQKMGNPLIINEPSEQVNETYLVNSISIATESKRFETTDVETTTSNHIDIDNIMTDKEVEQFDPTSVSNFDLNLNSKQEVKQASQPSFLLQRPKVFQRQNNHQAKNIYRKISNTEKDPKLDICPDADHIARRAKFNYETSFEENHKVARELPREITPFDLPVLSPVPKKAKENKCTTFNVQDTIKHDFKDVEYLSVKNKTEQEYSNSCSVETKSFEEYATEKSVYHEDVSKTEQIQRNNECKSMYINMADEFESSCNLETYIQKQADFREEEESHEMSNILELDMEEVKEYNVQAKIVLNTQKNDCKNTISSLLHEIKTSHDGDEEIIESSSFTNELQDLGLLQSFNDKKVINAHKPSNIISKEDNLIRELDKKFNTEQKTAEILEKSEIEESKDVSIAEHHKDMINKCIQELEESASYQLDEELLKISESDQSHNGIQFNTEKVIDNTDLEHVYVIDKKNVEKRIALSSETIEKRTLLESKESSLSGVGCNMLTEIDCKSESEIETDKDIEADNTETYKCEERNTTTVSDSNTFFLTESNSESDTSYSWQFKLEQPKLSEKRKRNRTIDYHNLPSLFWEGAVKDYHEKQFSESESTEAEVQTEDKPDDKTGIDIAKDGLSLILQRLKGIESKLDSLKEAETTISTRHDTRRSSLPGRFSTLTNLSSDSIVLQLEDDKHDQTPTPTRENIIDDHKEIIDESDINQDESNSNCSTPTFMEIKPRLKETGYDSDSTVYHESDCDIIVDEKSENEEAREETWTYKPFNLNISEISDLESEEEDPEERHKRIESLAAAINLPNTRPMEYQRAELNMEIDTLSERSEEEGDSEEQKPKQRSRRPSGRKRSMSRDRNVAKLRYCWRCHQAGHENWQCREEVQPGGWCPRCLETSHWEDACWVEAAHVLCPVCNVPGHLPCIHQATDFRQRKLVIDTFGWLPFKDWFQDLTFRSWWNCSGYTTVPLYKIMQRNPSQDLDLGFDEP